MKRLYIVCLLSAGLALSVNAQLNSTAPWDNTSTTSSAKPKKPTPPDGSPTPTNVPFDGGLGVLLVAGALYGKRVYQQRKSSAATPAVSTL